MMYNSVNWHTYALARSIYVYSLTRPIKWSVLPILIDFLFQVASGRGFFELEIIEMTNYRGELASGRCCGGLIHMKPCPYECHTYFRVCLKEYQINVTSIGSCSFGNTSSAILGGNSFRLSDPENSNGKLVLPFSFSWTVSLFCLSNYPLYSWVLVLSVVRATSHQRSDSFGALSLGRRVPIAWSPVINIYQTF